MNKVEEKQKFEKWKLQFPEAKLVQYKTCPQLGSVSIFKVNRGYLIIVDQEYIYTVVENFKVALYKEKSIWETKRNSKSAIYRS